MRAVPHRDVAAAVATVRASDVTDAVKLVFEFLVLTAARWGEVRWAKWTQRPRVDRPGGADEDQP